MEIKQNRGYRLPLTKIQIIASYKAGKSCYELAKICKCTPQSIFAILKKNNIKRRTLSEACRKYKHDRHYFDVIDTEPKAYFLGLLYADGNVFQDVVSIALQQPDKSILNKLKKALKYTGPIIPVKKSGGRQPQWKLTITSSELAQGLSKWGLIPNKGFHLLFPVLPDALYPHFIRGYFDGDGCIYINKKQDYLFSLVGTHELLSGIQQILIQRLGLSQTKLYHPPRLSSKNLWILTYQGRRNVQTIRELLYTRSSVWLTRKQKKFFSI